MKYTALQTAGTIALAPFFVLGGVAAYIAIQSARLYLTMQDKLYSQNTRNKKGRNNEKGIDTDIIMGDADNP